MKPKLLYVMPECFVDTNLIEYLLDSSVNHQHCCSKVVGTMKEKFADEFAIGIIDRDKVKMGYLKECDMLAQKGHLTIYKHKTLPHYLITIAPAIDKFVLDCAREQRVSVENYDLPSNLKAFTKETKQVVSNKDKRFKALFSAIEQHGEMVALRKMLEYLNSTRYDVDLVALKSLFCS